MTGVTWRMSRALDELMLRHDLTLGSPEPVALSDPTATPMLLSGLASSCGEVDVEHVMFAPFAFELPAGIPLMFNHTETPAGRIEQLAHDACGNLAISAYVEHETARRCNAFSVSCDVLSFGLHNTGSPDFYARIDRCRLREVSLVIAPVNAKALVLKREQPSAMSSFIACGHRQFDLSIKAVRLIQKELEVILRS